VGRGEKSKKSTKGCCPPFAPLPTAHLRAAYWGWGWGPYFYKMRLAMPEETTHTDKSPKAVRCVYCDSTDTELFSLYGNTLLSSQYYCNTCRTIFDVIRFDDPEPRGQTRGIAPTSLT
ncbi:MAG: hypothetical protein ACPGWR_23730, partial [Ardenticatenaceae bacterium]